VSELNDPIRVFESNPRKGMELLIEKQAKLIAEVIITQDQIASMLENRRLLETLPHSLRSDPIELGQAISAFRSLRMNFLGYQQALLSLAILCLDRDGLTRIAKTQY